MKYEEDLMASWDEYAIRKSLLEEGIEKGRQEFVKNLLQQTDFSISKIAELANVDEAFVRKVKKEIV